MIFNAPPRDVTRLVATPRAVALRVATQRNILLLAFATCLLTTSANAYKPGDRLAIRLACVTADDALEVGVSIDRDLPNVAGLIHDKIVDGACFVIMGELRRDDAVLVSVNESAENTSVWEVRMDTGRTLFAPLDREPGI